MPLKLVWDKSECILEFGHATIQAAPKKYPPFSCQAIVEEQDTHLILSEQTVLTDPGKPAWYLASTLERDEKIYRQGAVLLRPGQPVRLLAVIHDIEKTPTCNTKSIETAWENILQLIELREFTSVAFPLLGTVYGNVSIRTSIKLLREKLFINLPGNVNRIWLILPDGTDCSCLDDLVP